MQPRTLRGTTQPRNPLLNTPVRAGGSYQISRSGYRGIPHSVSVMVQLAREGQTDPHVRRWAESVIRQVTPKDYLSELAAIYYATAGTLRYTRDPAQAEYLQHPAVALRHRAADCDDQSIVARAGVGVLAQVRYSDGAVHGQFGAAAQSVGNQVQFVTAGYDKSAPGHHTHVFVRAYIPHLRKWVIMDPVAGPATRQMVRRCAGFRAYPT